MVDPLSGGWVDLLSEGKKEDRLRGSCFLFLLWLSRITSRDKFPLRLPSLPTLNPIWFIPDSREREE